MKIVRNYVSVLRKHELHGDEFVCLQKQGNKVDVLVVGDRPYLDVINFCSNDVLGFAQDEAVKEAAIAAIRKFGTTNSSSAALCGRTSLHCELEEEISAVKQLPHSHLFLNAWMAIQAFVDAFCHLAIPVKGFNHNTPTVIFSDTLNHSSLNSALANAHKLSGTFIRRSDNVRVELYRHCDVNHLRKKLFRYVKPRERVVVVTDSVFSMDGDVAPLPDILELLSRYEGSVIVCDEAHSTGAIGKTGRGIFEHFGLSPTAIAARGVNPILLTTFSKFAASAGAAISTEFKELLEVLTLSPTSFGTASLTPANTAAALESFRILRCQSNRVEALHENTRYLRSRLEDRGLTCLGSTHVVPVILPSDIHPKHFAQKLLHKYGVWVSAVWYVTRPRLRIVVNALHTRAEIDQLVEALTETLASFTKSGSILGCANNNGNGSYE